MPEKCKLCPRECGIDRSVKTGRCGVSDEIRLARVGLHAWEEPCLSYGAGSGTVFFSGCVLGCVFCQNHEISRGKKGIPFRYRPWPTNFYACRKWAQSISISSRRRSIPIRSCWRSIKQSRVFRFRSSTTAAAMKSRKHCGRLTDMSIFFYPISSIFQKKRPPNIPVRQTILTWPRRRSKKCTGLSAMRGLTRTGT